MFKIGDTVSKNDVFAAGWMFASFSNGMQDIVFVNEDNTMCAEFADGTNISIVQEYVCKELI